MSKIFEKVKVAVRGRVLHFKSAIPNLLPNDPRLKEGKILPALEYFEDGIIVVGRDGLVKGVGTAAVIISQLSPYTKIETYPHHLISSGFIDCHVHYPQVDVLASWGAELMQWLNKYTFPAERRFKDPEYAAFMADFFLDHLLRCGTTTALVFATVHKCSVEAFFDEAQRRKMRMICGKVLMDDATDSGLVETDGQKGYKDSKELIEKYHGFGRLRYAVTPRFAPTSTREQLEVCGRLLREYPSCYMHTHLAENKDECAFVKQKFPERKDYLDVYDHYGLLGPRSVFAHSIYLSDGNLDRLKETDSAIAWCAMSNMFLGSGLFNRAAAWRRGLKTGLGSDVGGGNNLSMLRCAEDSYKSEKLRGANVHPISLFYYMTLGGAQALSLDDKIGNFNVGKEADFVILDLWACPALKHRVEMAEQQPDLSARLQDLLFALEMLATDNVVEATYVLGEKMYCRDTWIEKKTLQSAALKTVSSSKAPDQNAKVHEHHFTDSKL